MRSPRARMWSRRSWVVVGGVRSSSLSGSRSGKVEGGRDLALGAGVALRVVVLPTVTNRVRGNAIREPIPTPGPIAVAVEDAVERGQPGEGPRPGGPPGGLRSSLLSVYLIDRGR